MERQQHPPDNLLLNNFSTSHLFSVILDFLSSVIQEKTWVLTQTPGRFGNSRSESPMSSLGDLDEDSDMYCDHGNDNDILVGSDTMNATYLAPNTVDGDPTWDMARFLLNEERDRLCLWQSNFTNEELDGLIRAQASTSLPIFGVGVLESLVRIGEALLEQTVQGFSGGVDDIQFPPRKDLESVVLSGKQTIQNMAHDPDEKTSITLDYSENFSTVSSFVSTTHGGDDDDLFSVLKSSIAMLHELGYAIQQIFAETSGRSNT